MNQKITTSRPVSTSYEIRLLKALDKAGADDCGEWFLVHPDDLNAVLTDSIKESLWRFRPVFLARETGLPEEIFQALANNARCEDNNPAILQIVERMNGLESFIESAVLAVGTGHFLAGYDGEEIKVPVTTGRSRKLWTAYRTN